MTHLEDSLRDYYTTKADQLVLADRVLDGDLRDDASVSYISIGPVAARPCCSPRPHRSRSSSERALS